MTLRPRSTRRRAERLAARRFPRDRNGLALPAALFAIVMLTVLVTGMFVMSDLNHKSSRNHEEWSRVNHLAEAGVTHVLGLLHGSLGDSSMTRLLLGPDGTPNTADDGLLTGYGIPVGHDIPAGGYSMGGGTYFVRLMDDPADGDGDALTDSNQRLLLRCRAVTEHGAESVVNAILLDRVFPGVVVNDHLEISGKLSVDGKCGGIHANGNMFGGGEPSVATVASATGSVTVSVSPKLSNRPLVEVPPMSPADYCAGADYTINGNFVLQSSTAPGTYCVLGNVTSSGDFGSWTSKKSISIIATGSIQISSKPFIRAAHPAGILLLAGGDLDLQGDWGGEGLVYGGGHCYVSSKPVIAGQLICMSKPDPAGATDHTDQNLISGDLKLTYDCGGVLADRWRVLFWYPTIGS